MEDPLMVEFLTETSSTSFASWQLFCWDHGMRHGDHSSFVRRLAQCQRALNRQKLLYARQRLAEV